MRPPKGFETVAKSLGWEEYEEGDVFELHTCIYGLKESGREWFFEWTTELKVQGFEAIPAEPCVMTKTVKGEVVEAIIFHVDDVIHSAESDSIYRKFLVKMQKKFPLKDLGRPQKFLGLYFENIPKGVRLHLEPYIEELLERFHLTNLPIAHAPAPTNRLTKKGKPVTGEPKKNYRAMLGAVLWIAVVLRGPDIGFSVIQCARFCAEPTEEHWKALLQIFAYLKGIWARLCPHSRRGKVATQGVC